MKQKLDLTEKLFFIGYILYCCATALQMSMMVEIYLLERVFVYTRYVSFLLGFIVIILNLTGIEEKGADFWKNINWKRLFWCAGIMLLTGVSSVISGDRTLLACVLFVMAAENIDSEKIIKTVLYILVGCMTVVLLSCALGVIPDLVFKRMDIPVRHALGFNYPSTVMSYLFFIFVLFFWLTKMQISIWEMIVIEIVNFVFYRITDSRFGFLMTAVLTLVIFFINTKAGGIFKRIMPTKNSGRLYSMVSDGFGIVLTAGMFFCCVIYQTKAGQFIDSLLTKRIQYIVSGIQEYGIHLFGNHISWIGFGGSYNTDSLLESYNYVDNSYAQILLQYGIIIFAGVLILLTVVSRKVRKEYNNGQILLILWVFLYSFIEPRLLDIYANALLFLAAPFVSGKFLSEHSEIMIEQNE